MTDLIASGIKAHFFDIESRYYVDYLLSHVDRNPTTGDIMGTGIKVFPNGVQDALSYHPNQYHSNFRGELRELLPFSLPSGLIASSDVAFGKCHNCHTSWSIESKESWIDSSKNVSAKLS